MKTAFLANPILLVKPKTMKKILVFSLICLAIAIASFITPPNKLVGRWQARYPDGSTAVVDFRKDDTYDVAINGNHFINGKYYVRKDTFGFEAGECGAGYYGTYLIDFSTKDSVRFAVIQDTCSGRKEDAVRLTFGRIKSAKP